MCCSSNLSFHTNDREGGTDGGRDGRREGWSEGGRIEGLCEQFFFEMHKSGYRDSMRFSKCWNLAK